MVTKCLMTNPKKRKMANKGIYWSSLGGSYFFSSKLVKANINIVSLHSVTSDASFELHNCFRPPFLLVEGLLSTGSTPSSFCLLVKMG